MLNKNIPGTILNYADNDDAFSVFKPMFEVTGGLSLSQVCSITGLQASTIQNWVKRSYVPHPENKKYQQRHLARILLISALRDCINIEEIGELMQAINGDTDDESDDIISESKLYDYFCKAIKYLDSTVIDDEIIEKVIKQIISSEKQKTKLLFALKTMVYAYISSLMSKKSGDNLKQLQNEK